MAVSVIISNFNGAQYLPRLLETLKAQEDVTLEIIVVDRNSTDDSPKILAQYPDVKVVQEPPESGLVAGYSAGVPYARYEHLFFCNEDMWFDLLCLHELEKALSSREQVWAVDPWQWTYDGKEWIHGGTRFVTTRHPRPFMPHPWRSNDFTVPLCAGHPIPFACPGAMMVKSFNYHEIGGWDTSFFLDQEDIDLFIRAWQLGWECITVPSAKVYHAVGASNSKTINRSRVRVSRRRYTANCANFLILSVKHFTTAWILLHGGIYATYALYSLIRLRFDRVVGQVLGIREFIARLPMALKYRKSKSTLIMAHPAHKLFEQELFQKIAKP
jgi:GT2 family glycosyltransferase